MTIHFICQSIFVFRFRLKEDTVWVARYPFGVELIFWLERFNGMQFTVVYSRFYETLIQADTQEGFTTDIKISELSDNIFVMYPYISVQKEFGYSDVTSSNNKKGYVAGLFQATRNRLHMLDKVKNFYSKHTI